MKKNNNEFSKFGRLVEIVQKLRNPDGCDWDKAQTRNSLIPYFIEEVYELIESIDEKDSINLREELGDVLLHVIFQSQIASEKSDFDINDVIHDINEKLILWKASKILLNITGNRWIISISNNSGLNSLAEIEEKEENKKIQQIKNDKFIKKFLEMIPSSEVTSIRENKEEQKFKNKGKK